MALQSTELIHLSESTSGRQINVAATSTAGTLIHTATATAAGFDLVFLYASNTHTTAVDLTIEWGGVGDPEDLIKVETHNLEGLRLVVSGSPINGGLAVRAFADTASVVNISGFVHRLTNE